MCALKYRNDEKLFICDGVKLFLEAVEYNAIIRYIVLNNNTEFSTEIIDKIATHDFKTTATAPTCIEQGYTTYICKCGYSYVSDYVSKLPHSYTSEVKLEPTHLKEGVEQFTCDCGDSYTKAIEKLETHTYTAISERKPTCTEDGYITYSCQCGNTYTDSNAKAKGHSFGAWYETKAATCSVKGEKRRDCSDCEDFEAEQTETLPHDYSIVSSVAPTCTADGKIVYSCACSYSYTETVSATGHTDENNDYVCDVCGTKLCTEHVEEIIPAVDPTCTKTGLTAGKKCSVCDETIEGNKPLLASGHKEVLIKGTPAACGVKGTTDASYCSVCNTVIKDQKELAALEHIMIADTANSKAPNCTTTGVEAKKCSREGCTYTEKTTLPSTHKFSSYTEIAATCTKDGKKTGYCSACKQTTTEVIPATGHTVKNNASWSTTTEATCTKDGVKKATCNVCGGTATKAIPATGHNIVTYKEEQAPTCEKEGSTASKWCSVCKTVTEKSETIPKAEHTLGEWTVITTATCAAVGLKKAKCSACNKEVTETIERLKHTERDIPEVPATCTTDGLEGQTFCEECNSIVNWY